MPVPTPDGPLFTLGFPYIAFDYSGALVLSDHGDVITNPARQTKMVMMMWAAERRRENITESPNYYLVVFESIRQVYS